MSNPVRLEDWSVVVPPGTSPFTAPESVSRCLHGKVYGHPRFEDGHEVTTSDIVSSEGRTVSTRSRVYELGEVDKQFLEYCAKNGFKFDPENPVKLVQQ
jgi:hypothetical protein